MMGKPETPYTAEELVQMLKDRQGGLSQTAYAAEIGISFQMLSDVYLGKRGVGNDKILAYLAPKGKEFRHGDCWFLVATGPRSE